MEELREKIEENLDSERYSLFFEDGYGGYYFVLKENDQEVLKTIIMFHNNEYRIDFTFYRFFETQSDIGDLSYLKEICQAIENWFKKDSKDRVRILTGHIIFETNSTTEFRYHDKRMDKKLEELELSVRAYNVLRRESCFRVGDILKFSKKDLPELVNMGLKASNEIINKLEKLNIKLKEG